MSGGVESVLLMIGMPRSGTTLVHSVISNHGQVFGVSEPFQSRREHDFKETNPNMLALAFDHSQASPANLCVKETTTRRINVQLSFDLLDMSEREGLFSTVLLLLRNPYESYLSQIEASKKYWNQKKLTEVSSETFTVFGRSTLSGFREISERIRGYTHRVTTYDRFCRDPENETARIMALYPLPFDGAQLQDFSASQPNVGDPKVVEKGSNIQRTDRAQMIEDLRRKFSSEPPFGLFEALSELERASSALTPDADIIDELTRITVKSWGY
ncbi:MAG: sulfotransferase domain-containing protein [Pseudomonadota bacterium]